MAHHTPHDHSYKHLFSHPEMVADLLRGYVREPWVEQLDFTTLTRVNDGYVSDDLREREDDIVWRIRWQGDDQRWLYVYLLLEFQSRPDRFMALRLMTYLGLLYEDLRKAGQLTAAGKLPPVLPLVLYNGRRRWRAPEDIAELIETIPGGLERYRPSLRYLLLDEGRFADQPAARLHRLAQAGAVARTDAGCRLSTSTRTAGGTQHAGRTRQGVDSRLGTAGDREGSSGRRGDRAAASDRTQVRHVCRGSLSNPY